MDSDSLIYWYIHQVADSFQRGAHANRYTAQHKADIVRRLSLVIDKKFPSAANIRHDGFKIIAQGEVLRIQRAKGQPWVDLVTAALNIPNVSDRAFALAVLAEAMPPKEGERRRKLLKQAKELVDTIPAALDRINRYSSIADQAINIDKAFAKTCLQIGMESSVGLHSEDVLTAQRNLVDLAYRLDPTLAASLASLIDDDPARKRMKTEAKEQLRVLEVKRLMSGDSKEENRSHGKPNAKDHAKAARKLLAALNAGTAQPIHISDATRYLESAGQLDQDHAYSIFSWFIENAIQRLGTSDKDKTQLHGLFDSLSTAAELAGVAATKSSSQLRVFNPAALSKPFESVGILVRPGTREEAMAYLAEWLRTHLQEYIKIVDPYFGVEQLEFLQIVRGVDPKCKVYVLTSRETQKSLPLPWDEAFRDYWKYKLSDQEPPETEIMILGTAARGELPIHDRWMVTKGSGLRLGTSLNSIGIGKESEISVLSPEDAVLHEADIDKYLHRRERDHNGDKLVYSLFSL